MAVPGPCLLVGPNIVDHGAGTPGEAPADGYTQRDIWLKGTGGGLVAHTPTSAARCSADAMVPARGRCHTSGSPPGTREVGLPTPHGQASRGGVRDRLRAEPVVVHAAPGVEGDAARVGCQPRNCGRDARQVPRRTSTAAGRGGWGTGSGQMPSARSRVVVSGVDGSRIVVAVRP